MSDKLILALILAFIILAEIALYAYASAMVD